MANEPLGISGRIAKRFYRSHLTPVLALVGLLLGIFAALITPREEEPQIDVTMANVMIPFPGSSAADVENLVTVPMEQVLGEIQGVKHIYSASRPGMAVLTVQFKVGVPRTEALVRLYNAIYSNQDWRPAGLRAGPVLVKPKSIDDVSIVDLTLWTKDKKRGAFDLKRIAAALETELKRVPGTRDIDTIGGPEQTVRVLLDPQKLAARGLSIDELRRALMASNAAEQAGAVIRNDRYIPVQAGEFLSSPDQVAKLVVGMHAGRPVYLQDVADIQSGPAENSNYVWDVPAGSRTSYPAVTLAIGKKPGENAVHIADQVLQRVNQLKGTYIPEGVNVSVSRNYGVTANDKANKLIQKLVFATVSVVLLVLFTLGRREAVVVGGAVILTLALTLFASWAWGFTLNRVSLFALIFSIGILVDDAIVIVENIVRHFHLEENQDRSRFAIAIEAVDEVGNPTILATLTVIAAILPMAFVGGLMGPYMRPIPVGASAAMVFSLLVAFIVTPWAAVRLIRARAADRGHTHHGEDLSTRIYRWIMDPLIHRPFWRWLFLLGVVGLLVLSCAMVALGLVRVKMLPFDNKSEFQVILDMPESATLERTAAAATEMGDYLRTVNEVTDYQLYVGTAAPFNFNGLVRHYYLRRGPNVADIQVNLAGKSSRKEQSHAIAKRVRPGLKVIADRYGARVKVAEVPPGPPVLSTLVAEIYGPDYNRQRDLARRVMEIFEQTPGVVDVDWYMEEEQPRYNIEVDQEKAALHGVSVDQIARTLNTALSGTQAGLLHQPREKEDVPIHLQPPLASRAGLERLEAIRVSTPDGRMISLSNLVKAKKTPVDRSIYHKNLMPVVYVLGDVAGAKESPVYAILEMYKKIEAIPLPEGYRIAQYTAAIPESDQRFAIKWDGEWHITYEVFRDLGIAFGVVLVLIFVLVVGWFQSFSTPLVIMMVIPLSLIGILPGHWLMGAFFTATSMIGFIAGAGIVVRNSIILVDFVELRLEQGMPLDRAVIDAGAVRFRPMMLTAAAVVVGASVILFDPIFQGLAISLMAGEVASLLFSRMTVPILYFLDKRRGKKRSAGSEEEKNSG